MSTIEPANTATRSHSTAGVSTATLADVDILAELDAIVRVLSQFASTGRQLWKASEALADNRRRNEDFLATLAHELRNQFAAIVAAAAILQQRMPGDDSAAHAIDVIVRQSHRVSRLVEDLLDIARIDSGNLRRHSSNGTTARRECKTSESQDVISWSTQPSKDRSMGNDEIEWWERQRQEDLKTLIVDARSLGLDATRIIADAPEAYRKVMDLGLNRELIRMDIRSELDAIIHALRGAIERAKRL
jgi:signal transduction histidine kinase